MDWASLLRLRRQKGRRNYTMSMYLSRESDEGVLLAISSISDLVAVLQRNNYSRDGISTKRLVTPLAFLMLTIT